jgi:AcrR family transcriptional regulator
MSVLNVSRRIARGMTAQLDLLERMRQEIVAAAARLLQPRGVLVPIRVVADRQKRARPHD